jgi:hypothetical protein
MDVRSPVCVVATADRNIITYDLNTMQEFNVKKIKEAEYTDRIITENPISS